nr:restriction endonuclease subunit S [uncultured Pseudoteredinibacter sp.]
MGNEWPKITFGELYSVPSRNGLTKPKKIRGEGFKFINMGEIFAFDRMLNIPCDRVPLSDKEKSSSLVESGDLLFARQSLTLDGAGKCSIFLGDDEPVAFESHLIRVRLNHELIDPQFAYYFFNSPLGKGEMWTIVEQGAGQAGIRGSDLMNLNIPCPGLNDQKRTVEILSSLDNKIQLNRQTNQTLEKMAQALFKSWFVDFDPVIDNALEAGNPIPPELEARAKQRAEVLAQAQTEAGKLSQENANTGEGDNNPLAYLSPEIRKLFPSEFEEAEGAGWVPKGWKAGDLSFIATALGGFAFKSKDFLDEGKAVIKIKNINASRGVDIYDVNRVSDEVASAAGGFLLSDGDLVMAMTGATVGKFGVIVSEDGESYYLNQRVCKLSARSKGGNAFLYSALNNPGIEEAVVSSAQGSAQPNISASGILSISMVVPPENLIEMFNFELSSLYQKRINLTRQNYKLANLRDTLLPKLISGELRLPSTANTEPSLKATTP